MYVCMYVCMYVYVSRPENPALAHIVHAILSSMVRSLASLSSSDSCGSLSSEPSARSRESAGAAERRLQAEQAQEERRRENASLWYRRRLVAIRCEMAIEAQLRSESRTSRQISGRISWFNRQCQGQTLEGIIQLTQPQLEEPRGSTLARDTQLLQRLFATPVPVNHQTWIYSDQVGNPSDPGRHLVEQRMQLLLQRHLVPPLGLEEPADFLHRAINSTRGNLYRDFILLMWPLVWDPARLDFQAWYQGRPTMEPETATEQPAHPMEDEPEPASSSGLRRGS